MDMKYINGPVIEYQVKNKIEREEPRLKETRMPDSQVSWYYHLEKGCHSVSFVVLGAVYFSSCGSCEIFDYISQASWCHN